MKTKKLPHKLKKKRKKFRSLQEVAKSLKPALSYLLPAFLGLLVIASGFLLKKLPEKSAKPYQSVFSVSTPSATIKPLIMVDIQGAVANPGLYELQEGSRIQDVVRKAGGMTENANLEWTEKYLNLAEKVSDATKIYIPKKGENPAPPTTNGMGGTQTGQILNINNATTEALDTLPGVGPVTAQKIIQNRPYQNIEDLKNKKAVNASVFEKIKDLVRVY